MSIPKLSKKFLFILLATVSLLCFYLFFAGWQLFFNNNTFASGTNYYSYDLANKTPNEAALYINENLKQVNITIKDGDVEVSGVLRDFGVEAQLPQLQKALNDQVKQKALLPFFFNKGIPSAINIDQTEYAIYSQQNIKNLDNTPISAKFSLEDNGIFIKDGKPGQGFDFASVKDELLESGRNLNSQNINAELVELAPAINNEVLEMIKPQVEQIANLNFELKGPDESYEIDKTIVLSKLVPNSNLDDAMLRYSDAQEIVEQFSSKAIIQPVDEVTSTYKSGKPSQITTTGQKGRAVNNLEDLTDELVSSVNAKNDYIGQLTFKELDFNKKEIVVDDTVRTVNFTYKIITWGTTKSNLDDFASKVAQTLADGRGWGRSGATFTRVNGASDFDIVLSEPQELPKRYPQWCDSTYSCRVGRYVIINDDRWRLATPSWNNANGSLRDYQHMVVNHEIGHRLGRGHEFCSGAGQLAPVMQQQSIDLQGCTFNPWPLTYEINLVRNSL